MNTLKGVFNSPRPVHRKNFIKENVRQLREMQICWQNTEEERVNPLKVNKLKSSLPRVTTQGAHSRARDQSHHARSVIKTRTTKSAPPKCGSQFPNVPSQKTAKSVLSENRKQPTSHGLSRNHSEEKHLYKGTTGDISSKKLSQTSSKHEITGSDEENICQIESDCTSRGCQTLDPSNMENLYYEGVIKYPSFRKAPARIKQNLKLVSTRDMALQTDDSENLGYSKRKTFSSSNSSSMGVLKSAEDDESTIIKSIADCGIRESSSEGENEGEDTTNCRPKTKHSVGSSTNVEHNQLKAPPNYQKGVVPKYLRERQENWRKAEEERTRDLGDPACPPGHVPLPEPDRKDTLKMLRKSYADLVLKLNMLPVRSDSLKTRQTKMQLEEQLNKLEEGIKVFSRPKVYVKVGA